MSRPILIVFATLSLSLSVAYNNSSEDGENWKIDRVSNGFTVYVSKSKSSGIVEIKVVGVLKAPLPAVMANLRDVEGAVEWTPSLIRRITVGKDSDTEAITYSVTDMPWPISDRSLIIRNQLKLDKKNKLLVVHSNSVEHSDAPESKGTVEAYMTYCRVALRPVGVAQSHIEFSAAVDPKGSIPIWIVNFYQKKWPVTFLKALEKRSRRPSPPLRPGLEKMLGALLKEMKLPSNYFHPPKRANASDDQI